MVRQATAAKPEPPVNDDVEKRTFERNVNAMKMLDGLNEADCERGRVALVKNVKQLDIIRMLVRGTKPTATNC